LRKDSLFVVTSSNQMLEHGPETLVPTWIVSLKTFS
jgi:hypothetical protein